MKKAKGVQFLSFEVGIEEAEIVAEIAERASAMAEKYGVVYRRLDAIMDISACHASGMPLRLRDLLAAKDGDFAHDVFGIRRHLNRTNGAVEDCFVPRFARRQGGRQHAS